MTRRKKADRNESQFKIFKILELSQKAHFELIYRCKRQGIIFFSRPFNFEAVDFLDLLGVPAFKLGSSDTNNIPQLKGIARKNKPILLSIRISDWAELRESVEAIATNKPDTAVFQYTTNYPCELGEAQVGVIEILQEKWQGLTGFSGHTMGIQAALVATALGVNFIENHLTIDRELPSSDQAASIDPTEPKEMVKKYGASKI